MFVQRDICTLKFPAALFTITKKWRRAKGPSIDEWIRKKWHVHTMEYNSDLKRKDILIHVTKDILSEISQSPKDECCIIPLI